MATPERAVLVEEVARAVGRTSTIAGAMAAIAEVLGGRFSLSRVSVRVLTPDGQRLVLAGVWSVAPTSLTTGSTMSTVATSLPEVVRAGRAVLHGIDDSPILNEILAAEGIRSWVSVPLRSAGTIAGLLSVSSRLPQAFLAGDEGFFDRVGAGCEDRILALAAKAGYGID